MFNTIGIIYFVLLCIEIINLTLFLFDPDIGFLRRLSFEKTERLTHILELIGIILVAVLVAICIICVIVNAQIIMFSKTF